MSEFVAARPRYTLPFAGKDYELLGTFGMIEAVEYAMKDYVGNVAVRLIKGMTSTDLAIVLSAVLTSCDHKLSPKEVSNLLWENVGLVGDENDLLRYHLYAFLCICLAPPSQRESRARDMGELLGKFTASPGTDTGKSA